MPLRIFITISQASILLPLSTGLANYRNLTLSSRILFYFFLACIAFEVQANIMVKVYHNNMPGLHLFTLTEFLVFSLIYYLFFQSNKIITILTAINMIVFLALSLADAFYIHDIWTINRLPRSYAAGTMLCYALIYFYYLFSKDQPLYSSKHPMFWTTIGVLVYFGSNILYFMVSKDLMDMGSFASKIGLYIHAALNIIANCLYAQSFRCSRQKKAL